MKKVIKSIIVFIIGIILGYYTCNTNYINNIFKSYYKAFQVGVYTNLESAITYSSKYEDAIIIEDNELYRVYVSILKNENNIENMSNHLNSLGIDYYLKNINIENKEVKKQIDSYESLMNNESEIVFLELNKLIIKTYEESL